MLLNYQKLYINTLNRSLILTEEKKVFFQRPLEYYGERGAS